ncbi:NAD/NADP octopine/nopaline dehydrogenase family protein [Clostridiaceae bacterium HSG29]|nr:NAD/NADP octopine/nopaline dehydrogenase family protein [Clostridiaceae bacterium HSG29]
MKKITIIGAGNGGVTAAYHFAKLGNRVCIYDQPEFDTQIKAIKKAGGIEAVEAINDVEMTFAGFEKIELSTTSMEEAVNFSDILITIVPSFAQETIFRKMLPYLTDSKILIFMPGNYASLVMDKVKKDLGYNDLNITYADAMTIPWACRLEGEATVGIMGIKEFIYAGVFPHSKSKEVIDLMNEFYPLEVKELENVIESGLENINFGGHPLIATINIGLLENFGKQFNYYVDCVSPATGRASAKMEAERIQIGKGLSLKLRDELEMMNSIYNTHAESAYLFNKSSVIHGKINSAPTSSKARYITEDVPNILVPCFEFATLLSLKVPIIESVIHIASSYNDDDYFKTGRTLEKMGLGGMSSKEIMDYVNL